MPAQVSFNPKESAREQSALVQGGGYPRGAGASRGVHYTGEALGLKLQQPVWGSSSSALSVGGECYTVQV